jgi:hypothetical protein
MEGELEVAPLTTLRGGSQDGDNVAVVERHAPFDALQIGAAADEGPVDAAAVDQEPAVALALERAVGDACDEALGVRMERDLVLVGQPADRRAFAGQRDRPARNARTGDDDLSCRFH